MAMWMYQLSGSQYLPGLFRTEIWENQRWHWGYNRKVGEAESLPVPGDSILFFYAPTGCDDPGFYGWGVIDRCDSQDKLIYFTPSAPTNHLKMDPWYDDHAKEVAEEIRMSMNRNTLFPVPADAVQKVRKGIKQWLSIPPSPPKSSKS